MKTLIRLFLFFIVFVLLLLGATIFFLTRPSVQKSIIEGRLPEGSSLGAVRVTTSSLKLSELKLALADGTKVRLGSIKAEFDPFAAVFDRTVSVSSLGVDGLVVELSKPLFEAQSTSAPVSVALSERQDVQAQTDASATAGSFPRGGESASPFEMLYTLGQLDWLLDIGSIEFDGELRDPSGSSYGLSLSADTMRPGEETTINASLKLSSDEALHGGLKEFDAETILFLKQNPDGGFEEVRLESRASASDKGGNSLLSANQKLELQVDAFEERAKFELQLDAGLPRPEALIPELAGVGALEVEAALSASVEGQALSLKQVQLVGSSLGIPVLSIDSKREFMLGGVEDFTGELMEVRLSNLPLDWLGPWLPEGFVLSGQNLSSAFNLTGLPDGGFALQSLAPLVLGPFSVSQYGQPLLEQISLSAQPIVRLGSDQSISWDLGDLEIRDRYGIIISGQSKGSLDPSIIDNGFLLKGINAEAVLNLGLSEIMQQPVLADLTSIMSGRASLEFTVDSSAEYPAQIEGSIDGLSSRSLPGLRQDYQFAFLLNETSSGALTLGGTFLAGSSTRPSTSLQFSGRVQPSTSPTAFKFDLSGPRISQKDLYHVIAAFSPPKETPSISPAMVGSLPKEPTEASASPDVASMPPPWADFNGEIGVKLEELVLENGQIISGINVQAKVSKPLLELSQLSASLDTGQIDGSASVRYSDLQRMSYALQTDLSFSNVDPAVFSSKPSASFPVQGLFDGSGAFAGRGATLQEALEEFEGELTITGREGVLTAFELDGRSQLGLLGAGLLGQHLNRPGITALAEAVPYFKNMPFSDFDLRMSRGADKRITVPEMTLVGDSLLINGSGFIAATNLSEIMEQPLALTLDLGAKGILIEYLETLQLLGSDIDEDGFRRWNQAIEISGTLDKPDTSALMKILNDAARGAWSGSESRESSQASPNNSLTEEGSEASPERKKTKDERLLEDIQTGADLFRSLLGN
ncbi:MAG: hypothetical protein AAF065_01500 [Verrucomicrobiota bacterium]